MKVPKKRSDPNCSVKPNLVAGRRIVSINSKSFHANKKIGYIRVSSQDQNLDRQLAIMEDLNIDKLFRERASGKDTKRTEFQRLLNYIREGDCVIVASLGRLGRDYVDIKNTVAFMKQKKVVLKILDAQFLISILETDSWIQLCLTCFYHY